MSGTEGLLDHAWIAARIPHAGAMCLLDCVEAHGAEFIVCRAGSHRLAGNPLRQAGAGGGRLGVAAGIEYAAQAMAVHAAQGGEPAARPRAGFLASLRDLHWQCGRLDDLPAALRIRADRLADNGSQVMYAFRIECAGREILRGRATVMLDAATPPAALRGGSR